MLVIEKDQTDFEHNAKEFGSIVDRIDAQLFGLFDPSPQAHPQPLPKGGEYETS